MARRGYRGENARDFMDDFFFGFNGVQGMLGGWDQRERGNLALNLERAAMPYNLGQIRQNYQTQQIQDQLYNSLLNGQINMDEYATAIDTFGTSPQMRAQNYWKRQNADRMYDIQLAKLAAIQGKQGMRGGNTGAPKASGGMGKPMQQMPNYSTPSLPSLNINTPYNR